MGSLVYDTIVIYNYYISTFTELLLKKI